MRVLQAEPGCPAVTFSVAFHRFRSVFLILQILLNIQQVFFYSVFLNHLKGNAIYSSTSLVYSYFFPCPPQNIQAKDTVIESHMWQASMQTPI